MARVAHGSVEFSESQMRRGEEALPRPPREVHLKSPHLRGVGFLMSKHREKLRQVHSKLRIFNLHDGFTYIIDIGKNRFGLAAGDEHVRGE